MHRNNSNIIKEIDMNSIKIVKKMYKLVFKNVGAIKWGEIKIKHSKNCVNYFQAVVYQLVKKNGPYNKF